MLPHDEWKAKYTRMRDIADRISSMRVDRARQACKDAGLDPGLLGIHPHNAMCALKHGSPWPNVDYSKVRLCLRIMRGMTDPSSIIARWDKRIRGITT